MFFLWLNYLVVDSVLQLYKIFIVGVHKFTFFLLVNFQHNRGRASKFLCVWNARPQGWQEETHSENRRSANHLMTLIKKYIRRGRSVISDGGRSYRHLQDKAYKHLTVNLWELVVHPGTAAHPQNLILWGVCQLSGDGGKIRRRGNHKRHRLKDHLDVIVWT